MGARLVTLVLTRWTHVSDRAFRLLVRMALTALDDPSNGQPAHLYFGGRDLLAMTLRSERGGSLDARYRVVKYALTELIEAGAIERGAAGRAGRNAVYRLTLDRPQSIDESPVDNPTGTSSQGESSVPPEGECGVPPQGEHERQVRGNPAFPPRNQEEPVEELLEDTNQLDLRTAVTGTSEPTAAKRFEVIDGSGEDPTPTPPPIGTLRGNGFCIRCHANGKTVLAADTTTGAYCLYHLRTAAS